MIYEVAITRQPSELERQAGKTEEIILPPVHVTAEDSHQAVMLAVYANDEKIQSLGLGDKWRQCKPVVRKFQ